MLGYRPTLAAVASVAVAVAVAVAVKDQVNVNVNVNVNDGALQSAHISTAARVTMPRKWAASLYTCLS
jgi:hypothetical protein